MITNLINYINHKNSVLVSLGKMPAFCLETKLFNIMCENALTAQSVQSQTVQHQV